MTRTKIAFLVAIASAVIGTQWISSSSAQTPSWSVRPQAIESGAPSLDLIARKTRRLRPQAFTEVATVMNCSTKAQFELINVERKSEKITIPVQTPGHCSFKTVRWNVPWCRNHDDFKNRHYIVFGLRGPGNLWRRWVIWQSDEANVDLVRWNDHFGWYPRRPGVQPCAEVGKKIQITADERYDPPIRVYCF